MNRDIFNGLPLETREILERYEPGCFDAGHPLGEIIGDEYLAFQDIGDERGVWKLVESFKDDIDALTDTEGQAFLNTIIQKLEIEASEEYGKKSSFIITPVLNALYDAGHDSLYLDLQFVREMPEQMLRHARGSEEKQLSLVCLLPSGDNPCEIGKFSHNLTAHIRGYAENIGCFGSNNDFTIDTRARLIGMGAKDSVFRLPGAERAELKWAYDQWYVLFDPVGYHDITAFKGMSIVSALSSYKSSDRSYVLTVIKDDKIQVSYLDKEFFKENNTLLIPDPDKPGEWKEVRPR